jgi:hypothetical protein
LRDIRSQVLFVTRLAGHLFPILFQFTLQGSPTDPELGGRLRPIPLPSFKRGLNQIPFHRLQRIRTGQTSATP